ncbi:t-SNARE [Ramaria rubella]|nr:t-SNARE [Ramaria rubella]
MNFKSQQAALTPGSPLDAEFLQLQLSLSLQVFKINANVEGMLKLLGTGRDTGAVRKGLHDLTDTTREMTSNLLTPGFACFQPHQKTPLQKTSHDFQLSLVAFQRAQQVSAERQRLWKVRRLQWRKMSQGRSVPHHGETASSPGQRQAQMFQSQLSPAELSYQESLIHEREAEIREIETGIHELEQGGMLDNIESNITSVAVDTSAAATEAGRRAACLMIVLVIVICIVLLAVRALHSFVFGRYFPNNGISQVLS